MAGMDSVSTDSAVGVGVASRARALPSPATAADETRVPKYYAVKLGLLELLADLPQGSMLPTERALSARYAASRTTVRQALHELEVEGWLRRVQGSGTFVARPKIQQRLSLTSFTEDMREQGLRPDSRLLSVETVLPEAGIAEALGLSSRAKALCVRRLRLADDEPAALETLYLPARRVPGLQRSLGHGVSVYRLLDERYGIRPVQAEETIETSFATPTEAALLGADPGTPHLLLHRRTWDESGQPVEYVRSLYRGDRYRFVTELQRPSS